MNRRTRSSGRNGVDSRNGRRPDHTNRPTIWERLRSRQHRGSIPAIGIRRHGQSLDSGASAFPDTNRALIGSDWCLPLRYTVSGRAGRSSSTRASGIRRRGQSAGSGPSAFPDADHALVESARGPPGRRTPPRSWSPLPAELRRRQTRRSFGTRYHSLAPSANHRPFRTSVKAAGKRSSSCCPGSLRPTAIFLMQPGRPIYAIRRVWVLSASPSGFVLWQRLQSPSQTFIEVDNRLIIQHLSDLVETGLGVADIAVRGSAGIRVRGWFPGSC